VRGKQIPRFARDDSARNCHSTKQFSLAASNPLKTEIECCKGARDGEFHLV